MPKLIKTPFVAASMATLSLVAGCNTVSNQASNAEGVRLYTQGSYEQAAVKFQEAIATKPDQPDGYYNLAASLHKSGVLYSRPEDLRQAEVKYNQCLERNPNHVECYRGLAVLLRETNRPDAAFRLLNNWNAASPENPDPKIELARLLEETGQAKQAQSQLVAALAVDPNNSRAFTALGRLRDQAGDYRQALADYQRSLQLNRFQPQVEQRIAALNAALGGNMMTTPTTTGPSRLAKEWRSTTRY